MEVIYIDTPNLNKITNPLMIISYISSFVTIFVAFFQNQAPYWVLPFLSVILFLISTILWFVKRFILLLKLKRMDLLDLNVKVKVKNVYITDNETLKTSEYTCDFNLYYSFFIYKYKIEMKYLGSSESESYDIKIIFTGKNKITFNFFYKNIPYNNFNKKDTQVEFKGWSKMDFNKIDKLELTDYYYTSISPQRNSYLEYFEVIKLKNNKI